MDVVQSLIAQRQERIFTGGQTSTVVHTATIAEDVVRLDCPAEAALRLQCPPGGGA